MSKQTMSHEAWVKVSLEKQALEDAIERVRELHKPYELTYAEETVCDVCYDQFGSFGANLAYPCPTIKALDGNHEQG